MLDFLKSLYKKVKGIDKKDVIELVNDVKETVQTVKKVVSEVQEIKEKLEIFINDLKK